MSFDPQDLLLTSAEISVAFVGFASLVAVFLARQREQVSALEIRSTIQPLLDYGLLALAACLVPFIPLMHQSPETTVWAASSGFVAVALVSQTALYLYLNRGQVGAHLEANTSGWFMFIGDGVALVLLGSNVLGWPFGSSLLIYYCAAVLWNRKRRIWDVLLALRPIE